jgi:hypothetical protein
MTGTIDGNTESLEDYVRSLAETQGVSGFTRTSDGTLVYGRYDDGSYDLYTESGQLTDTEADITGPEWLDGRETLLASRDEGGNEQYDLLEVDPNTGDITPVLDGRIRRTLTGSRSCRTGIGHWTCTRSTSRTDRSRSAPKPTKR